LPFWQDASKAVVPNNTAVIHRRYIEVIVEIRRRACHLLSASIRLNERKLKALSLGRHARHGNLAAQLVCERPDQRPPVGIFK
jgi:hypothetical protein